MQSSLRAPARPFTSSRAAAAPRRAAVATRAAATKGGVDLARWKAIGISIGNLKDSQGGRATRNVDGTIYEITYDAAADKIGVLDRARGVSYPAMVGEDARIRIDLQSPSAPAAGGAISVDALAAVLRGDQPAAEVTNCRAAMVGFLGIALTEVATGRSGLEQLGSAGGVAAAVALSALTLAASVAPALAGAVPLARVFPDDNDPHADRRLPYYFSSLAEKVNGRAAMIGIVGLLATEASKHSAVF